MGYPLTQKSKQKFIFLLKLLVGGFLIIFIFHSIQIQPLWERFSVLPWWLYIITIVFFIFQSLADTLIKDQLFRSFGQHEKFKGLWKHIIIGSFFSFFTPSLVGGDPYYIYYFGKKYNSFGKVTSGIVFIKAIGLVVFIWLSSVFVIQNYEILISTLSFNYDKKNYWILIVAVITGFAALLLVFIKNTKIKELLTSLFSYLKGNRKYLLRIIIFSLLYYFVAITGRWTIGRSLGIDLPFIQLTGIILIVSLIVMLPVTVSGIGIREGSYIAVFALFGIDKIDALTLSLFDFGITLSGVIIGGILQLHETFIFQKRFKSSKKMAV